MNVSVARYLIVQVLGPKSGGHLIVAEVCRDYDSAVKWIKDKPRPDLYGILEVMLPEIESDEKPI